MEPNRQPQETFSKLEQEIWEGEIAYWEHLQAADLEGFMSLWHDDFIGWPSGYPAPVDKEGINKKWSRVIDTSSEGSWEVQLKPLSIRVMGEIGLVYYETHRLAPGGNGPETIISEKRTHTWMRTKSGWVIIGGMSAPLPTP